DRGVRPGRDRHRSAGRDAECRLDACRNRYGARGLRHAGLEHGGRSLRRDRGERRGGRGWPDAPGVSADHYARPLPRFVDEPAPVRGTAGPLARPHTLAVDRGRRRAALTTIAENTDGIGMTDATNSTDDEVRANENDELVADDATST